METTGTDPDLDAAVQVAAVRFEGGRPVGQAVSLVDPCQEIPEAASAIHGITSEMVRESPPLLEVLASPEWQALVKDAQPGAFNASFDRRFLPAYAFGWESRWPWLDSLTLVREVDRFERGKGRHKLAAACERHGVRLGKAHDAGADAEAAGSLFYVLAPKVFEVGRRRLGDVLLRTQELDARQWWNFAEWLSRQPAREEVRT